MEIKAKLTIGTLVRWEQLTGKCFSEIDYTDEKDMKHLLYCSVVVGEEKAFTFPQFEETLTNKKVLEESMEALKRENDVFSQFTESLEDSLSGGTPSGETSIMDIAGTLIVGAGVPADYVMNSMRLCDLPLYIKAYDQKQCERMEAGRLWAYYNILPHVDGTKLKCPRDMLLFPWEEAEELERITAEEENLEKFLAGELFDINSINWKKREE